MYKQRSNWSRGGSSYRGSRGRGNRGGWRGRDFHPRSNGGGGHGNFRGNRQGGAWPRRDTPTTPGKRLAEEDIGITEYVSKHDGFTGVIKSRYADFQVSEIGIDGRVAKLTDLEPPQPPKDADIEEDEELLLNKYNLDILPMDMWDKINSLVTSETTPGKVDKIEIDATTMSKEQRTKIHDAVKKAFGTIIIGSTVNEGDKKWVTFQKYQKGVRIDTRVKWVWPAPYTHFIVHKENIDTMEAAVRIADKLHLGIKPTMLGYAGTKDRRAKTSQWFSLRKVDPRKIAAACKHMRDVKLRVGNFEFREENLVLGMLKGNRFRIALRNVTTEDAVVRAACEQLERQGFLNYYGLQRFGTRCDTPTHHIGLHMLQGKFKEAVAAILEEREGPLQGALRAYHQHGPAAALREWGLEKGRVRGLQRGALELRLLRALAHNPKDLLGALGKLARNTRLLYLHSYQSMVWNRAVSERVRRLGLAPAAGDAVRAAGGAAAVPEELLDAFVDEEDAGDSSDSESQSGDDDKMADENKMADDAPPDGPALETSTKQSKIKIPVKILTQEDIDTGKYTIFDIVMPLPGNMVDYPPNMKDYYVELLAKDGLTLEMKHKIKAYALSGAYRNIVVRPSDVSYRLVRYSDPFADLIRSDWDELQGTTDAGTATGIVEDGEYKALLLSLSLPASCYATMALRELLKRDTSGDAQAKGNQYHIKKQSSQSKEPEVKLQTTKACTEEPVKPTDKQPVDSTLSDDIKQEQEPRAEDSSAAKRKIQVEEESDVKRLKKEVADE